MAESEQLQHNNGNNLTASGNSADSSVVPTPENPTKGRIIGIVADILNLSPAAQKLRDVLQSENYEVVWSAPSEILYSADAIEADAVVVDATGLEVSALCERIKRNETGENLGADSIPVIALASEDAKFTNLIACGVEDSISENTSVPEMQARLSLAVRLGQAQRELRETRDELRRQIQVDDLSGALNRRFFFQSAYRECSRARRYGQALSCLMVDIDHFHLYNTSFGYGCGDYILREIATLLKNSVRDTDLVARFGGSKFVVLLTHTDTEGAIMVRQKVENWVKNTDFVWQHQRLPVSVSIGEAERVPGRSRAMSPDDMEEDNAPLSTREDLAELLEDADSALYIAKKGARFPSFLDVLPEQSANKIV